MLKIEIIYSVCLSKHFQHDDDKVRADFERDSIANVSCFDWKEFTDPAIRREFSKILATKQLEESERKER